MIFTKLVDMTQATKYQDAMEREQLCTCPKTYLWESIWFVYTSISVIQGWAKCHYRLWPPRVPMTVWQRRRLEEIKRCTRRCGMFYHSCCSAVRRCGSVWGCGGGGGGCVRIPPGYTLIQYTPHPLDPNSDPDLGRVPWGYCLTLVQQFSSSLEFSYRRFNASGE